jgi:hypothetical protein
MMDSEIISDIAPLVESFRTDSMLEFEVRIGQQTHTGFSPGVNSSALVKIDALLRESKEFDSTTWGEDQIYHFVDEGREKRTVVRFPDDTFEDPVRATMEKTRVRILDAPCRTYTLRFALSREQPSSCVARVVQTTRVTIRQRTSHTLRRRGKPYMQYDLSRRWSASTKTEAERMQSSGEAPVCDIEVELCDRTPTETPVHIVHSMLMKVRDLISKIEAEQAPNVWC